jgi:arylsulfatase A-like enzyme
MVNERGSGPREVNNERAPAPDVVLVVLDTARADVVGAGHDTAFAQLGRTGRRFHRAIAPAPWTLPSHASMFSGMRPSAHGITGAAILTDAGPRAPTALVEKLGDAWLPEALRRSGSATFAASGNPWIGTSTGLTYGFETVFEAWHSARLPKLADPLRAVAGRSRMQRLTRSALVHGRRIAGAGDGGAGRSLDAFEAFLGGIEPGVPFFAFFNVIEPHAPYTPPLRHDPTTLRSRPAALRAVRKWNAERMIRFNLGREEIDPSELALLRDLYRGEVAYADAWLARLLELVGSRRALDETIVIVTADHGENLGEHHLMSHVMSMHETLLHVPLVIAGPGVPGGEESAPVSVSALGPMILSAGSWRDPALLPVVAEYESASSQVTHAGGLEDRVGDIPEDLRQRLRARWIAKYEERFKYAASSAGEERLVDLESDPGEEHDVTDEHPDVLDRLRESPAAVQEPTEHSDVLEAEITAHLEGLGYL